MVQDCYTGGRGSLEVARRLVEMGMTPSFGFYNEALANEFEDNLCEGLRGKVEKLSEGHVPGLPYVVTVSGNPEAENA